MLSPRFNAAFLLAHELHGSQGRKGKQRPYIGHLLGVCALVLAYGGDEDEAIAALLHDAPEDRGGRPVLEKIREQFGERVARIVEGCTDTFEDPSLTGGRGRKPTSGTFPARRRRYALYPPPTSCTTFAKSWPITAKMARRSGSGSAASGTARCGITMRW
jgi:hypothetical protein